MPLHQVQGTNILQTARIGMLTSGICALEEMDVMVDK